MAKPTLDPRKFAKALEQELTLYHQEVIEKVDAVGEKSIKKLVKRTKTTAPERTGSYRRSLKWEKVTADYKECSKFRWGAKAPHHRLTHLLVNGHDKANGGRVDGDPFLERALDEVLPEYEAEVKEALQK